MKFESARGSTDRMGGGMTRSVLSSADDTQLLQELSHQGFPGEQQQTIEHAHPYGFSTYPKKPSMVQGVMRYAAAFGNYLRGNRSHGVVLQVADRRFRLYKMKEGEVALHDDQGQWIHLKRNGILVKAPNGQTIQMQIDQPQQGNAQPVMGQDSTVVPKPVANVTVTKNTINVALASGTTTVAVGKSSVTVTDDSITENASTVTHGGGKSFLQGQIPVAMKGTVDTGGYMDISGLATNSFTS
jgi:phage gp45-like